MLNHLITLMGSKPTLVQPFDQPFQIPHKAEQE